MSDLFEFICPNCGYEPLSEKNTPWWGVPIGEKIKCDKCKKEFKCVVEFKEVK